MRENLKYFVKNIFACFLSILILLLFGSLFIPKTFAQPIHVTNFSDLRDLLADSNQSGIQIQIDTPTIVSVANYNGCGKQKYIIGSPAISVLDGQGFFGIYGNGEGQELHLSSITLCNFSKTAGSAPGDQKNGATLFFKIMRNYILMVM